MRVSPRLAASTVACLSATWINTTAKALPIGFGVNQGDLKYDEVKSDHFYIYLDHRAPAEGQQTLNALEAARPYVESWLGQHRTDPLPVIMSAQTTNASFANPITDVLEIQTGGQGDKELAWHEYTHATMYRQFDTFLGRGYNFLPLIPMPAWFLEGLAEMTSVSVGSDVTAGIERYQALSGDWPTYDRLHSLYSSGNFAMRGYATSGAFVSYILRSGDANKLPTLLSDYEHYLWPWYWPVSVIPGHMPIDHAMKDFRSLDGADLYVAYKAAATAHWKSAFDGPFFVSERAPKLAFRGLGGWTSDGSISEILTSGDQGLAFSSLVFDDKSGWAIDTKREAPVTRDHEAFTAFRGKSYVGIVKYLPDAPQDMSTITWTQIVEPGATPTKTFTIKRKGLVSKLWELPRDLAWYEQEESHTSFCLVSKDGGAVNCPLTASLPEAVRPLGQRASKPGDKLSQELWFSVGTAKLTGTLYEVRVFDAATRQFKTTFQTGLGQPIAAAFTDNSENEQSDTWLLLGERDRRTLRRYTRDGTCQGMALVRDHIIDVKGLASGELLLGLYGGQDQYIRKVKPSELKVVPCTLPTGQMSPLQFAMLQKGPLDLATALQGASIWRTPSLEENTKALAEASASPTTDKAVQPETGTDNSIKPAAYRARPVFMFPWIGANDAYGPQFGVVSVPLMDHMQNETVQASFLYGLFSNFPNTDISLTSTRWRPTLNVSAFRQHTFNGILSNGQVTRVQYMDEIGSRFQGAYGMRLWDGVASVSFGLKYSHLRPIIGFTSGIRQGYLVEPSASFAWFRSFGRMSLSAQVSGRVAPALFNRQFDYNQLGGSVTAGFTMPRSGRLSLGIDGSRTRGKKMRELREYYLPLRTFIPGSGGGYNQNSFALSQANSGLFTPIQSNSQGRIKADYTVPIITDINKSWWLLYFEQLNLTAFYNYGAGWNGARPRRGWDKLLAAHGYALDLHLENKGVNVNLGIGAGKVVQRPDFQPYLTAGFDALF
ncbi:MAG: hypothetical protein FJ146_08710 [Deltaproteobacteria bacterium]|nr:hypothetical protein [Deltaproteobacteria bacterium]